MKKREGVE